MIKYKTFGFLPSELEFTFDGLQDLEYFFEILVSQQYFYKAEKHLNFLQANFRYLLGLALVALCTIVGYNTAIDIENGVEDKSTSGKQVIFNFIVKFLGKYGVLLLGATIAFYILKKIWSRFKIPPFQIKYLPLSA